MSGTGMFAGYPAPWVYAEPVAGAEKVQQLLWGDWVLATDETQNGFRFLEKARNSQGWIREVDLLPDRLLEVNFVDVGQGDGCFIVTPADKRILIDAGAGSEMFWYLQWRFNLRNRSDTADPLHIDQAIISHPDLDHYGGFKEILDSPRLSIGTLFHNGIVDRANSDDELGPESPDGRHLVDVIRDRDSLERLLADPGVIGKKPYPGLMRDALGSNRIGDIVVLSADDGHLPGYASGELTIDVLGPVPENLGDDAPFALRKLGSTGETKNGHSVALRVTYGSVTLGLGGDLNVPAQRLLLDHHAGIDDRKLDPAREAEYQAGLAQARATFQVDIAKACHHGSSDVLDFFLEATNAIATVISSGDNESYSHPRADALGLVGKYGRGKRPLIFSTELARSNAELKRPEEIRKKHRNTLDAARHAVDAGTETTNASEAEVVDEYQRAIAVWGMITLRTDGQNVLMAQKLEKNRGTTEFQIYCLEPGDDGLAWNPKPKAKPDV